VCFSVTAVPAYASDKGGTGCDGDCISAAHRPPLRLFPFGMEKARRKVAATFRDFDEDGDDHWFVG